MAKDKLIYINCLEYEKVKTLLDEVLVIASLDDYNIEVKGNWVIDVWFVKGDNIFKLVFDCNKYYEVLTVTLKRKGVKDIRRHKSMHEPILKLKELILED